MSENRELLIVLIEQADRILEEAGKLLSKPDFIEAEQLSASPLLRRARELTRAAKSVMVPKTEPGV